MESAAVVVVLCSVVLVVETLVSEGALSEPLQLVSDAAERTVTRLNASNFLLTIGISSV
jgi:hypothetical protein